MSDNFSKVIKGLKIDPMIFTFKFACKCNGECCHYGVYTDFDEFVQIMKTKDEIIPCMDSTQNKNITKWFERPEEDDDFNSGIAVGTEIINRKCTFLDKEGYCTLQKISLQKKEDKWKRKPLYCILFPLTVYQGALTVDHEHIDRLKYCNKYPVNNSTIFEYCKEEIIHLLGEDGYEELSQYREEYFRELEESKMYVQSKG